MPRKNPLSNGGRKKTLLCIDDQADGLVIRQKFLEQLGYSVLIAESGRAGLRLLSEQSIDLVVLDYRMPELDGSQVATEIRRLYGRLPIVMLSAYPPENIEGVDYTFQKPVGLGVLEALVAVALNLDN